MSRSQIRRPASTTALGSDDTGCTILHVDMDAFFALVSLRSRPQLRGKPVIIGGAGRGVVLSATYEARALGVHSAMPVARARRLAPHAIVLPPDFGAYREVSTAVMALFESITPLVEPLSMDEAFLDVSGATRLLGSPSTIAALIRARVHDEQDVTCSIGVASTKFVAKLASTQSKPDGLLVVPRARVLDFLHPLPVGALWGVGEKTERQLTALGLRTVQDIAAAPLEMLEAAIGKASARHLHELSWGRDPRSVRPHEPEKSIGHEVTFDVDLNDPVEVHAHLLRLSDTVAARLRRTALVGRTVSVKVRFADFTTVSRSRTLSQGTDVGRQIYETARQLYHAANARRARVRLVGVRMEGLSAAGAEPRQLVLDEQGDGHREAEVAVDAVRARFGSAAVRPARLIEPKESR